MKRAARLDGSVFVDTHAFVALVNADDRHHDVAARILGELTDESIAVFTSDWVLAEFLSVCSKRPLRAAAGRVTSDVRGSSLTTVIEASRETWDRAFALFRSRRDKEWSLVDRTSMVLCGEYGIRRVLTHDSHFSQAGLEVMIP